MSNKFQSIDSKYHCTTYNVSGLPIPLKKGFENSKILSQKIPLPAHWSNQPKITSLSQLKHKRYLDNKVDPSYDITGDGTVGIVEYKIARHFDKNKDGILDSEERKLCIEHLKKGFELPKIETPDKDINRYTRTKMQTDRKDKDRLLVEQKWSDIMDRHNENLRFNMEENDRIHQQQFKVPIRADKGKKLVKSLQRESQMKYRGLQGMYEDSDIKIENDVFGLGYSKNPKNQSQKKYLEEREESLVRQNDETNDRMVYFGDDLARIQHREAQIPRHCGNSKTMSQVKIQRKLNMIREQEEKFGEQVTGIHGFELPKYQEHNKIYWKNLNTVTPLIQSQKLLNQNKKYWIKNEQYVLNDLTNDPPDFSDKNFVPIIRKQDVSEKALTKNFIHPGYLKGQTSRKNKRFTDQMLKFIIKPTAPLDDSKKPMFSSFNQSGIFIPPKSSKDSLAQQIAKKNQQKSQTLIVPPIKLVQEEEKPPKRSRNDTIGLFQSNSNLFKRVQSHTGVYNDISTQNTTNEFVKTFKSTTSLGVRTSAYFNQN